MFPPWSDRETIRMFVMWDVWRWSVGHLFLVMFLRKRPPDLKNRNQISRQSVYSEHWRCWLVSPHEDTRNCETKAALFQTERGNPTGPCSDWGGGGMLQTHPIIIIITCCMPVSIYQSATGLLAWKMENLNGHEPEMETPVTRASPSRSVAVKEDGREAKVFRSPPSNPPTVVGELARQLDRSDLSVCLSLFKAN